MKHLISVAAVAMTLSAGAATAQPAAPVTTGAEKCGPRDMAAAVACLDKHLTRDAKAQFVAPIDDIGIPETWVGMWVRNNWGLWGGSDLNKQFVDKGLYRAGDQSQRIVWAYWLKAKGCKVDFNDIAAVKAGVDKAKAGGNACTVTATELAAAKKEPLGVQVRARRGAAAAETVDD